MYVCVCVWVCVYVCVLSVLNVDFVLNNIRLCPSFHCIELPRNRQLATGLLSASAYIQRMILVVVSVIIAINVAEFEEVLGMIGGLTDAMLAFVLPAVIFLLGNQQPFSSGAFVGSFYAHKWFFVIIGLWGLYLIFQTLCRIVYFMYSDVNSGHVLQSIK